VEAADLDGEDEMNADDVDEEEDDGTSKKTTTHEDDVWPWACVPLLCNFPLTILRACVPVKICIFECFVGGLCARM
jgi:hypothetical protein